MNQYNDTSGLSLPNPSLQPQLPPQQAASLGAYQNVPAQTAPQQAAPVVAPPMMQYAPITPSPVVPQQPAPVMQAPPTLAPVAVQAPVAVDHELDDEALDAEWVNKAKAIVEQTHNDPYVESNALNKVRAEYLQRRYGKEIKVRDK